MPKSELTYTPPYTSILVERGVLRIGCNESPGGWERDPQGHCVALVPTDENDKQCGEAQLCGYSSDQEFIVIRLLEMLGIRMNREFMEALISNYIDEGGDASVACVLCDAWDCGDCPEKRREFGAPGSEEE